MPEYIISSTTRAANAPSSWTLKAAHTYNMEYDFPVSTGPDDDGPSLSWQLKAHEEHVLIRANLVAMRRRGRWNFVDDLQPLAPRGLAKMVHQNDAAGLLDYFMLVPGGRKSLDRSTTLKEFQDVFAVIKPPEVVDRPNLTSTSPR